MVRTANWFTHLELDWDSAIWRHWFEALADGRTLVRYDPRGSGLSDRVATEMALHVLAYNLTRVMNIIGVQPLLAAMRA